MGMTPRYTRPEDMQTKIDAYFTECDGKILMTNDGEPVLDRKGQPVIIGKKPPTVTGLARALGFTSRQTLLNYQGKPTFVDTITRAKLRIEEYAETRLYDRDGARGAEFTLKFNFGWHVDDRPQHDGKLEDFIKELERQAKASE